MRLRAPPKRWRSRSPLERGACDAAREIASRACVCVPGSLWRGKRALPVAAVSGGRRRLSWSSAVAGSGRGALDAGEAGEISISRDGLSCTGGADRLIHLACTISLRDLAWRRSSDPWIGVRVWHCGRVVWLCACVTRAPGAQPKSWASHREIASLVTSAPVRRVEMRHEVWTGDR